MKYLLSADLSHTEESLWIYAENAGEAMMQAIPMILDKAMQQKLWAVGHVCLSDESGNVVAEMEAK